MKLNELINNAPEIEINQLSTDSRVPMDNAIFFCLDGIKYDGHNYVQEAIKNGAIVIVHSKEIQKNLNAIYIKVNNVNELLKKTANIFYNNPNADINKYIISGCYGRSSVNYLITSFLNYKSRCGSIGIMGIKYDDRVLSLTFPALTALDNLMYLNRMKSRGIKNCVFETSAISLNYKKMDVIKPEVFIYTNTSKICSDYQVCNSMYFSYIRNYLYTLEDYTKVVLNYDDEAYYELKDCVNNILTYGINENSIYRISSVELHNEHSEFNIIYNDNIYKVSTKLLNLSNVYNLTAAIVALHCQGYELEEIIEFYKNIDYFDGVLERIDDKYNIIIDSAYELDSIENLLTFAKHTTSGKVIGILGINYNDDANRIEQLMKLADKFLDVIILTEDMTLEGDISKILSGADEYINNKKTLKITYRSIAIENAIQIMNKDDTLLIIGKGNEKFLSMGLGKEKYAGDKHYAIKYLKKVLFDE